MDRDGSVLSFEVGRKNQEEEWKFTASISQSVCCWPKGKPEGPLFSAEFVCLSVCVYLTGTSTLQR